MHESFIWKRGELAEVDNFLSGLFFLPEAVVVPSSKCRQDDDEDIQEDADALDGGFLHGSEACGEDNVRVSIHQ